MEILVLQKILKHSHYKLKQVNFLIKAVVFDFNGVIIDSVDLQRFAFYESYKISVGEGSPSFEDFLKYSGDSVKNIFVKMNLPLEMVEHYKRISREKINDIKLYDGIIDLLRNLYIAGCKCSLCTGKDRERTVEILKKLNIYECFDTIICSDDIQNPKPHPEGLLYLMRYFNIMQENIVMVGDGCNDILFARNAGVKSIAVTWGEVDKKILEKEQPDFIVSTTNELLNVILNYKRLEK